MKQKVLIADSGSTKTDWTLVSDGTPQATIHTQGLNPCVMDDAQVEAVLQSELLPHVKADEVGEIWFYGAGCRDDQLPRMMQLLQRHFPSALSVNVASDLLGAVRALCGDADGIACILGTGSNSCLFEGGRIVMNVPPMGYVLGDEGSGAVLGKRLLSDVYKGRLPEHLVSAFHQEYADTLADAIRRVYNEPCANRYLASFAPFLSAHQAEPAIRELLNEEFARFVERNVLAYGRTDLPVSFVGSIAEAFREVIDEVLTQHGLRMGRVIKAPMDGLVCYHA